VVVEPGRVCIVDAEVQGKHFRFVNMHLPNQPWKKKKLLDRVKPWLCTNKLLIVGGDLNISLEEPNSCASAEGVTDLLDIFKLKDVFRDFCSGDPGFTWPNAGRGGHRGQD